MPRLLRNPFPILSLALTAALVLAACQGQSRHPSPTEPALDLTSTTAEARGGNGGGNNGHGGGNGGGGQNPAANFSLALDPDVWNTNWAHSQGTVSALLRGGDPSQIDLASIKLVGTKASAAPLAPLRVQRAGNQVRAFFSQSAALATLDTPQRGEVHDVKVTFSAASASKTLIAPVRIVGPSGGAGGGEEGDYELEIQPDSWNTNWNHSSGTVTALIRGGDLPAIDLHSIKLVGTLATAAPLPALRASLSGNHVRAFFSQSGALATLDTPRRGEVHTIKISLQAAGAAVELTDRIRIEGPDR
jgi:hypothetical protein